MVKYGVTEKELMEVQCNDFSIQSMPNGKAFLILICKDQETSLKLMEILRTNAFDLKIFIDEKIGSYSLQFEFIDADLVFRFDTGKDEEDYPPLAKLKSRQIRFITTGIWTGKSSGGRNCMYDPGLMLLGLFDIGDAFRQAKEVHFISGESDKEPSVIMLVYDDHKHIMDAEADEGYNRLLAMAKMNPMLEIKTNGDERVDLRIWDVLVDLDIRFGGLQFSKTQLADFVEKTDSKRSFAFVLGLATKDGERPIIVCAKGEEFEGITLAGYHYKK